METIKIDPQPFLDKFIERTGHNPTRKKKYKQEWITSKEFYEYRLLCRGMKNRNWEK